MSRKEEYEKRTEELAMPFIEEDGLELVDVEFVKEAGEYYLRIYADKEGGINISDCEKLSRAISPILDREDFIEEGYIFEVSSPGLFRPLKKERDYQRNLNRLVEIRTYKNVDGAKQFVGTLTAYDGDSVTILEEKNKERTFSRQEISRITQYVKF